MVCDMRGNPRHSLWLSSGAASLTILTLAFLLILPASGVLALPEPGSEPGPPPRVETHQYGQGSRFAGFVEFMINKDDEWLGVTFCGAVSQRLQLGAFFSFSGRITPQRTLVEIEPNLYMQREEERFLVSGGLNKILQLNRSVAIYLDAGAGYTFGEYNGTEAKPEDGWTPLLAAGVSIRPFIGKGYLVLRLGYQYADRKLEAKNWLYLGLGGVF